MDKISVMAHLWFDGDTTVSKTMRNILLMKFGTVERIFELHENQIRESLENQFDEHTVRKLLKRKNTNFRNMNCIRKN